MLYPFSNISDMGPTSATVHMCVCALYAGESFRNYSAWVNMLLAAEGRELVRGVHRPGRAKLKLVQAHPF